MVHVYHVSPFIFVWIYKLALHYFSNCPLDHYLYWELRQNLRKLKHLFQLFLKLCMRMRNARIIIVLWWELGSAWPGLVNGQPNQLHKVWKYPTVALHILLLFVFCHHLHYFFCWNKDSSYRQIPVIRSGILLSYHLFLTVTAYHYW